MVHWIKIWILWRPEIWWTKEQVLCHAETEKQGSAAQHVVYITA